MIETRFNHTEMKMFGNLLIPWYITVKNYMADLKSEKECGFDRFYIDGLDTLVYMF